jgi:hypothetical protein
MAADMSGEQMQAKITAARREAEGLKDKIKRRKDELADTTCKNFFDDLAIDSIAISPDSDGVLGSKNRW